MEPKQYDLIGKKIKVVDSRNKTLIGLKGLVVDETRNMIVLDNQKKIAKKDAEIKVIA